MEESMYDMLSHRYAYSGFVIRYRNHRTSRSREILSDEMEKIELGKHNGRDVPVYLFCSACEVYMDFTPGPEKLGDGCWRCPECGVRVREMTAYNQFCRENREEEEREKKLQREIDLEDYYY